MQRSIVVPSNRSVSERFFFVMCEHLPLALFPSTKLFISLLSSTVDYNSTVDALSIRVLL